jgi:hypothetical protein
MKSTEIVIKTLREHADDTGLVLVDFELTEKLYKLGVDGKALGDCLDFLIEKKLLALEADDYYRLLHARDPGGN